MLIRKEHDSLSRAEAGRPDLTEAMGAGIGRVWRNTGGFSLLDYLDRVMAPAKLENVMQLYLREDRRPPHALD